MGWSGFCLWGRARVDWKATTHFKYRLCSIRISHADIALLLQVSMTQTYNVQQVGARCGLRQCTGHNSRILHCR